MTTTKHPHYGMNTNPVKIANFIIRGQQDAAIKRAHQLQEELEHLARVLGAEMANGSRKCEIATIRLVAEVLKIPACAVPFRPSGAVVGYNSRHAASADREAQWQQAMAALREGDSGET